MKSLHDTSVLVTRTAEHARTLLHGIKKAGGHVHCIATVVIEPLPVSEEALQALQQCDVIIFISVNAVRYGASSLTTSRRTKYACVGPATRAALKAHDYPNIIAPSHGHGGEALLAVPAMQKVAGQHIAIMQGEAGLSDIRNTLQARGATVREVPCYRRVVPRVNLPAQLCTWQRAGTMPCAVTITSVTHLRHLFALADQPAQHALRQLQFITASTRIAATCRDYQICTSPHIADGASDEAMLGALLAWRNACQAGTAVRAGYRASSHGDCGTLPTPRRSVAMHTQQSECD